MYGKSLIRYGLALLPWWPVIALSLAAAVLATSAAARARLVRGLGLDAVTGADQGEDSPPRSAAQRRARLVRVGALGALLALALTCAWRLLWFADDAFISLHYARNWIEGHGLVYNPGERVEGYTNFLWLALIAAGGRLGLDLPLATVALNLASYVAVILLADRTARDLLASMPGPARTGRPAILPFAAAMTALSYPMVSFATSGLETVFCALLVLAAARAAQLRRPATAGTYAIFATMAHPDHAIFYVAIAAVILVGHLRAPPAPAQPSWWRHPAVRELLRYSAPFALLYVPYFLLRWRYYGDPLPNTFYTKAGEGSYYAQGLRYLWASALVAGLLGVVPAFALGAHRLRHLRFTQIVLVAVPIYLWYVARIGGDFMTGRLLVSALPLLFVVAELGVRTAETPRRAACLVAPLILACLPTPIHRSQETKWFLSDERTYWQVADLHPMTLKGEIAHRAELLRHYFPTRGPRLSYAAFEIGYVAWRTRFRIVDVHGLIDRELARMPVAERGRPGHEHKASNEYLLRKGTQLATKALYPPPYDALTVLQLGDSNYYLARYQPELLSELVHHAGATFTDLPRYLDDYLPRAASIPADRFAADLAFFDTYYFSSNSDPARRAALLAARAPAPP